jgi:large repetitive protein
LLSGQQSLTVKGTSEINATVQVYLNGNAIGTTMADGQGNWTYNYVPATVQLAAGVYSFSGITTDVAGNVSSPSRIFKLQIGSGSAAPTISTPKLSPSSILNHDSNGNITTTPYSAPCPKDRHPEHHE